MRHVDVLVVGAGPAGAVAALNLAPLRSVAVLERRAGPGLRIGESLAPAARRLLADMGLLESFEAQGHARCHANRIVWGQDEPVDVDRVADLDGPGWHLDRARFEAWLCAAATARGAQILAPVTLGSLVRRDGRWRALLAAPRGEIELAADLLIDASGRSGGIARTLGARRRATDKLVAGWVHGDAEASSCAGLTFVEAVEDGWWYTAPLPGSRRILAFHTDADLPAARIARSSNDLVHAAMAVKQLGAVLTGARFAPTHGGFTAAHSSLLDPAAGRDWLAAGDAALAFDPVSSRGLFNALFTGLAAAEAADRHLSGDSDALPGYCRTVGKIAISYDRELAHWYGEETRWPSAPFWQRRHERARHSGREAQVAPPVGQHAAAC